MIEDLQKQLNRTIKLTEPLEGVQFEYGYNTEATGQVVKYWRETYLAKWSERQKFLNSLPQYTTEIQGYILYIQCLTAFSTSIFSVAPGLNFLLSIVEHVL